MILRPSYLDKIKPFINKTQIKIITGIRRSGKSTVLRLLKEELLVEGIKQEQIIAINFESFAYSELLEAPKLYLFIKDKIKSHQKYYLLLDEIQEVEGWEKAVNSFIVDFDVDIYLTGSNFICCLRISHLSCRKRYRSCRLYIVLQRISRLQKSLFFKNQNQINHFLHYLRKGGFPVIHTADYPEESAYKVVYDIYSSVILRDTVQRYKIRDVELLERVIKYAFDNIGNTFSGKNVADYFKSQQRKVDVNTVYNYLNALKELYIIPCSSL